MTQWVGHRPANRKAAGLIPGQGTDLGCGPGPGLGVCERQLIGVSLTHRCLSPSLFPSLYPFLQKYILKIFKKISHLKDYKKSCGLLPHLAT